MILPIYDYKNALEKFRQVMEDEDIVDYDIGEFFIKYSDEVLCALEFMASASIDLEDGD